MKFKSAKRRSPHPEKQAIKETTLVVRIGHLSQTVTTKNGKLNIEVFDHDPEPGE